MCALLAAASILFGYTTARASFRDGSGMSKPPHPSRPLVAGFWGDGAGVDCVAVVRFPFSPSARQRCSAHQSPWAFRAGARDITRMAGYIEALIGRPLIARPSLSALSESE